MRFNLLCGIAALGLASATVSAAPVQWTLQNFRYSDGGTASGSFVFDVDLATFGSINITTTAGTVLPGAVYSFTTAFTSPGVPDFGSVTPLLVGSTFMNFAVQSPMTNAGGTIGVAAASGSIGIEGVCTSPEPCASFGTFRNLLSGGSIVGTPIPEAGTLGLVSLAFASLAAVRRRVRA